MAYGGQNSVRVGLYLSCVSVLRELVRFDIENRFGLLANIFAFVARLFQCILLRCISSPIHQFKYNQPLEQMRIQANVCPPAPHATRPSVLAIQFNAHNDRTPAYSKHLPHGALSVSKILRIRCATPILARPHQRLSYNSPIFIQIKSARNGKNVQRKTREAGG